MFQFLAFITANRYWRLHSLLIGALLRARGIKVGRRFHIEGVPKLKIRGRAGNIVIGDDVSVLGDVDLRNRENGRIVLRDHSTVEGNCRLVSAREGTIELGEHSIITAFAIINGGADVIIGRKCIIGPRASINANEHLFSRDQYIRDQGFLHKAVHIEDDCWLAANITIMKGVRLARGTVVGSNAVVTADTEPYGIYAGIPARKIGERT